MRAGKIDPIVGREAEIRQVIDILLRRRQNNPILTGEAGVGKTAIVEGLAQRIVAGSVPPSLREVRVHALDLGLLQAGASMKGEFEQRLRNVIDAVQQAEPPVILFIDEAHTLIGAGGQAGTADAANLLKPALARGAFRCIAATTWGEYKKYIEKDPALTRRFQAVVVNEPETDSAVNMLRHLAPALEQHHGVQILDDALLAAVHFSQRYLPDRQLPDKAISLLDTVCARAAVARHAPPGDVEQREARLAAKCLELARRQAEASDHNQQTCQALCDEITVLEQQCQHLRDDWARQLSLATGGGDDAGVAFRQPIRREAIARVIQDWTGIPVAQLLHSETSALLNLEQTLNQQIAGQEQALAVIADHVRSARAGLQDAERPIGVFLLTGPSGVGKSATARTLAEQLYGSARNLISVNMGEFQEPHTVSTLKGAPPGYVGYGQGGVLTEAVRRQPYSVLLLDEVEKAHPDVHELFYQVFDQGWMEDGEGRRIDFRHCLILLTSNCGDDSVHRPGPALEQALRQVFPAALLARMTVVPYQALDKTALRQIACDQLQALCRQVADIDRVDCQFSPALTDWLADAAASSPAGARQIRSLIQRTLMPPLARKLLASRPHPPQVFLECNAEGPHCVFN